MGKSFILYTDQMMALSSVLSAEQLGRLMQVVLTYQATGQEPEAVDADLSVAWAMLKVQFQVNDSKYQETIEKRREAGRKGGLARVANQANASKTKQEQANGSKCKQNQANQADNDNVNVNVNDNVNDIVIRKRTRKVFIKPTLEEVRAYCRERGNGINPEKWMAHYEANGWKVGKAATPMVDWKACIRTWEGNSYGTPARTEGTISINNTRYESNDY